MRSLGAFWLSEKPTMHFIIMEGLVKSIVCRFQRLLGPRNYFEDLFGFVGERDHGRYGREVVRCCAEARRGRSAIGIDGRRCASLSGRA